MWVMLLFFPLFVWSGRAHSPPVLRRTLLFVSSRLLVCVWLASFNTLFGPSVFVFLFFWGPSYCFELVPLHPHTSVGPLLQQVSRSLFFSGLFPNCIITSTYNFSQYLIRTASPPRFHEPTTTCLGFPKIKWLAGCVGQMCVGFSRSRKGIQGWRLTTENEMITADTSIAIKHCFDNSKYFSVEFGFVLDSIFFFHFNK